MMSLASLIRSNPKLRQRARRLRPVRPSKSAEVRYRDRLLSIVKELEAAARNELLPLFARMPATTTVDGAGVSVGDKGGIDWSRLISEAIDGLKRRLSGRYAGANADMLAREAARQVKQSVDTLLSASIKMSVGIDIKPLLGGNAKLETAMRQAIRANVELIGSIPVKHFDGLESRLLKALHSGARHEVLAKILQEQTGVTASRAKLIARDQVGKMNSDFNRERQLSLGIKRYTWRTAQDERVRDEHADLDGEVFSWLSPPNVGHPGEPIQCRCVAEALFELDEEDEAAQAREPKSSYLGTILTAGALAATVGGLFSGSRDSANAGEDGNPDQPRDERGRWTDGGSVEISGAELGRTGANLKELRRAARAAGNEVAGKSYKNESTGNEISVGKSGLKHTIHGAGAELLKTIPAIPTLIQKSKLVVIESDKSGDRNVLAVEKYKVRVVIGKSSYTALLTVKHHLDGRRYYDHGFIKMSGINN